MKKTFFTLILVLCTLLLNCQNSGAPNTNAGKQLIEADFLAYTDSIDIPLLKKEITESFNIYDERNNKFTHIDAEELAEFNFDFFLPSLNQILSKRNIVLEVMTSDNRINSQTILINGEEVKLYSNDEISAGKFWDSAARNFFRSINRFLEKEKCEERFYLLYGGNELHTFLLTNKQQAIIAKEYKEEKDEIPYLP